MYVLSLSSCRCFNTKRESKKGLDITITTIISGIIKFTGLPIDTTGMPSKSSREPFWWGSVLHYYRFLSCLMVVRVVVVVVSITRSSR